MTPKRSTSKIAQIPLERITITNPRARNRKAFDGIVKNIKTIGLKRPITVIRKSNGSGDHFDLVCGQGRLEAYKQLGQAQIPALVVEATEEEGLVMSLVENIARRQHRAIDLLHDIEGMKRRGHSEEAITARSIAGCIACLHPWLPTARPRRLLAAPWHRSRVCSSWWRPHSWRGSLSGKLARDWFHASGLPSAPSCSHRRRQPPRVQPDTLCFVARISAWARWPSSCV